MGVLVGEILGTCGHKLEWKNDGAGFGNLFFIKEYSGEDKGITQLSVCDKCAKWYRQKGHSFKTYEEAMAWLEQKET